MCSSISKLSQKMLGRCDDHYERIYFIIIFFWAAKELCYIMEIMTTGIVYLHLCRYVIYMYIWAQLVLSINLTIQISSSTPH
jgi:hypothetical protein